MANNKTESNNKTKKIIIIAVSIVVFIAALILILCLIKDCNGRGDTVIIESDGVVAEEYTVSNLNLYPGSKEEFELSFLSKVDGTFALSLDFSEISDGGLKPFVVVDVLFDGELMSSESLSALLSGESVNFDCSIQTSRRAKLKIIYKMPIETDDSAQNTTASFNVKLKIESK